VDACTVALLLDIDPISLVRTARRASLRQYVNDRPYVASSFMSSAILKVFGSAMSGASQDRPELAATAIPLVAGVEFFNHRARPRCQFQAGAGDGSASTALIAEPLNPVDKNAESASR
jgi:hypothetical protein